LNQDSWTERHLLRALCVALRANRPASPTSYAVRRVEPSRRRNSASGQRLLIA
jgi:hypothetical protein